MSPWSRGSWLLSPWRSMLGICPRRLATLPHWHFWRNRLFLLTKNALLKRGPKNLGMGTPPIIRAIPERKRFFFFVDPFPYPSLMYMSGKIKRPVKINHSAVDIFWWKLEQPKSVTCTLSKMFQNHETWEFFRPRTTLRVSSPGGWCDHSFLSDHDADIVDGDGADDD